MKRLFTLILVLSAFVFAFTSPLIVHNAAAQSDDAATNATDDAMKGDHEHGSPANENNKTNHDKGRKHMGHHHKEHKGKHPHHKHHKKEDKGGDAGK